nr:hypothetical protein HK105_000845 [Polyrhizophydium stewartii]
MPQEEIRKAYRRQALKCHPDKLPADSSDAEIEAAKDAFQELSRAYAVLSDPLRRKRYDATGSVNESILDMKDDGVTWDDYFRELWSGVVNEASIGEFKVKYQCKWPHLLLRALEDEERRDVLAAYLRTKGCLLSIIDVVPLSTIDDIERFKVIIQSAIDSGEVEHFKRFPQVSPRELARRRSQLKREAKEVEAAQAAGASGDSSSKKSRGKRQESSGSGSEASLAALIKARNAERLDDVIDKITQKYAPKPRGRPRKRPEPSAPAPQAAGESSSKKRRLRDAPLRPDQAGRSRSEHVEDVSQSDPRTGAVQDPARDTAANHGVADDNTHSPMFSAPIVLANPDGASSASNIQHSDVEVDAENHAEESDEPITELRIKKSGKAINPPTRESLNANDDRRGRRSRK